MRHLPDEDFKWILHIVDHWSKFNLAFPLVIGEIGIPSYGPSKHTIYHIVCKCKFLFVTGFLSYTLYKKKTLFF